ncbi:MAG: HisA/HisF-related TIM barrel protein [Bacteroidota bacterium]|jgi:phosphoribosylformimino-5-aminoimidazole carboxamide ribotide isomerase|nr:HisA/HisF-related TIM barrel protein [Bacteroidota bacterium]
MLVIPAMHIRGGCCTRTAVGEPGTEGEYPLTPVELARLWRGENAKALHVGCFEFDTWMEGVQARQLREVVQAVDIAVQLAAPFENADAVRVALDGIGVYRVVLDAARFSPGGALDELIGRYGPRRIVVGIDVPDPDDSDDDPVRATAANERHIDLVRRLEGAGVHRVFVTRQGQTENLRPPPVKFLLCLTETTNLSITLNGSVRNYRDLKQIQSLSPRKLDSVVLDEVLYTNVFPCQRIWRLAEQQLIRQHRLL